MNIKIIKGALLAAVVATSGAATAYTDEKLEVLCKKPKFHDFSLPEYAEPEKTEVAPGSEFEFKVSVWADPKTVKLTAKKQKLEFTVESTTTFHRVKSKLPASLNGKFARIDASVKAELGCDEQEGWLVKIADTPSGGNAAASQADNAVPKAAAGDANPVPVTEAAQAVAPAKTPGASATPTTEPSNPPAESGEQAPQ